MKFTNAHTIEEALATMSGGARPVAGGSDLVVGARQGKAPLPDNLVAIDRIPELAGIDLSDGGLRIGAMVTHATLMSHPTIVADYTALADSSALVGSPSTRNVGSIGGNVMNASPAMDTGAPLLVFGATAELRSTRGSRQVPLSDLWTGPGETSAATDELLVALELHSVAAGTGSAYVRLEYRRAMEIAVVGAAARVALGDDGTIASADVALTAVAPTVIKMSGIGDAAVGTTGDETVLASVAEMAADQSSPISDLRASDRYRRHCVGVMARRALDAAVRRARGEEIAVPVNRALGIGAA